MKIAIPVDDKSMETNVCQSFGRAPYFLIYDTDSQESEFIDNSAAASRGGAGIKAAQTMVDNRVDALLTPRCGENASEVLNSAHIKIYKTTEAAVTNSIKAFINEQLSLLDEIHPGFHQNRNR